MPKVKTITLGCRFNFYETEVAKSIVERLNPDNDVVIINTCAVTHEAERQSKQAVRKAIRENAGATVVVTGCATVADTKYFDELSNVTVIRNGGKTDINEYLGISHNADITEFDCDNIVDDSDELFQNRVRAFLPIQNGCNNFCTYCIVPYTRGRSKSLPLDAIIRKITHLISIGFKEIVLSGIDITSYRYEGLTLADVISKILSETSLERLRITSLDPAGIDNKLVDIITNEDRIMPHFHLSIQSGDNDVLKAMRRRHTREDVIKLCNNILDKRPDVVFGSDFIAGFPAETDDMFENTIKFVDEAHISLLHVFPFSPRSGTVAAKMIQLPSKTIHMRAKLLRAKSQKVKEQLLKSFINKRVTGMIEKSENGTSYGKTDSFIPFCVSSAIPAKNIITGIVIDVYDEYLQLVFQ